MKRLFAVAVAALFIGAASASTAAATPIPSFVATSLPGLITTLDATASPCQYGPCGYTWRYFSSTTNRLGVQMGYGARISYTFPAIGWYTVVLKVSSHCSATGSTWCWGTTYQQVLAIAELPPIGL